MVRASEHFLGRYEWEEIDRRMRLVGSKVQARDMAAAWWSVSTGTSLAKILSMPPILAKHPRLRLLPMAWWWLHRWEKYRKDRGLDFVHDAPLFCSARFNPPRAWPARLRRMALETICKRAKCGRLAYDMFPPLARQFAEPRILRVEVRL